MLVYRQRMHSLNWLRCDLGPKPTALTTQHCLHLVHNIVGQQAIFLASAPPLMIAAPRGHVQTLRLVILIILYHL